MRLHLTTGPFLRRRPALQILALGLQGENPRLGRRDQVLDLQHLTAVGTIKIIETGIQPQQGFVSAVALPLFPLGSPRRFPFLGRKRRRDHLFHPAIGVQNLVATTDVLGRYAAVQHRDPFVIDVAIQVGRMPLGRQGQPAQHDTCCLQPDPFVHSWTTLSSLLTASSQMPSCSRCACTAGRYLRACASSARAAGGGVHATRRTPGTPKSRSTAWMADSSPWPRSCRSSATITAAGSAPAALMICMTSRMAVPAVITSSTTTTRPCRGAPTKDPPSPWSLASLRLKQYGRSTSKLSAREIAAAAARGMPL